MKVFAVMSVNHDEGCDNVSLHSIWGTHAGALWQAEMLIADSCRSEESPGAWVLAQEVQ